MENIKNFDIEKFIPNKNTIIEASAGTGKTFTITGIVKKLLEQGNKLSEILIVTYTEKAVGELRNRIRRVITESENLKQLNCDVDNAPVFTIHSFCQRTLQEFSYLAGKPANISLVADGELDSFVEQWLRDYDQREALVGVTSGINSTNPFSIIKDALVASVTKYYLNINGCEDKSIVSLVEDNEPVDQSTDNSNQKLDESSLYKSLLPELYLAWQQEKEKTKKQSYDDMLRDVREAVCSENSQLLIQLRNKYKYAIIDEFQDTNQKQWDTFKKVFLDDPNHFIIVVGDPKQSIYAFQGADWNAYQKAKNDIAQNGEEYRLGTNYRSTDDMIKACNHLFSQTNENAFFKANKSLFFTNSECPDDNKKKAKPEFKQHTCSPIWVLRNCTKEQFAEWTVNRIIECCSRESDNSGTNLQVFDKKNNNERRNVTFKDFAILGRTRTELDVIENALRKKGVPFIRYKDTKLFSGSECANWISLLNAINQNDFSGSKQGILNEALMSRFFNVSLKEINNNKTDFIDKQKLFIEWHLLAETMKWSELFDSILNKTGIEKYLSTKDKIQSLSIYRQIMRYALNYLYENACDLDALVKHLKRVIRNEEKIEEGSNFTEIGTDFDCVHTMTIHASKGLEFPIVIPVAGFINFNDKIAHSYLFHDDERMPKLGFNNQSKNRLKDEQKAEWERLFYVAYTRASSILILPQYVGTDDNWFGFRNKSLNGILNDDSAKQFIMDNSIFTEMDWDKAMKEILENQKTIESEKPLEENHFKIGSNQKNYKHSYSSLSKGNEENEEDITEIEQSKVESENADLSIKFIDTAGIQVPCKYTIIKDSQEDEEDRYPRGTKLGSAVHKVFEELVFSEADTWRSNGKLDSLIRECFDKYNLHIDETDSKGWLSTTSSFVWNTMNAHLPLADGGCFSLKSIQEEEKKPEIEFNFNMDDKLINYCNGFMDLLFKRGTGDNARFFILDWKSDKLDSIDDYWKDDSLKSKVDKEYSVQRVLYSYCLIKWLSQIYEDSEENVFKNHFGGVYYVFFRGCKEGTGNGIYAHTWKTWQDLSKSYSNVVNRMKGRRGGICR